MDRKERKFGERKVIVPFTDFGKPAARFDLRNFDGIFTVTMNGEMARILELSLARENNRLLFMLAQKIDEQLKWEERKTRMAAGEDVDADYEDEDEDTDVPPKPSYGRTGS